MGRIPVSDPSPMTELRRIREELMRRSRFLLTSHARPDGDSIGSQVAMAAALRAMGKSVRLINRDAPPPAYLQLPGVAAIEVADRVPDDAEFDACIVMECSDIARPGVAGIERFFLINIDHHAGNTLYGAVNWFDESAAACGEMVADVIDVLDMPWTREIGTALYLAILTDTGSFRHGNMTARTFEVCRRVVDAGVDPVFLAQTVFDSGSVGKLKLIGAMLNSMQIEAGGRMAILDLSDALLAQTGTNVYDTDGIINMPFMASEIETVALIRTEGAQQVRVSLRSKGDHVDVREIAGAFGGGGHRNASGFTVTGDAAQVRQRVIDLMREALEANVAK
jgi:bifunctional oligoribonuclease and PAP phosphatase NrnA